MAEQLAGTDALLLPTTTRQPTLAEVHADPIGANRRLGRYTNATNLLDRCAVAIPAGEADGGCFGVSLLGPAFADKALADLARRLTSDHARRPLAAREGGASPSTAPPIGLRRQSALCRRGAPERPATELAAHRSRGDARAGRRHRRPLPALRAGHDSAQTGLVRSTDEEGGRAILGELWRLQPTGLASLLADLPTPMTLGRVTLDDGSDVVGFLCEPAALATATDITSFGGWLAYLTNRCERDPVDLKDMAICFRGRRCAAKWAALWRCDHDRGTPGRVSANMRSIAEGLAAVAYLGALDTLFTAAARHYPLSRCLLRTTQTRHLPQSQ